MERTVVNWNWDRQGGGFMKSPISFQDWLIIMGIVLLAGALFLLLETIPFTSGILDKIRECSNNELEYISLNLVNRHIM